MFTGITHSKNSFAADVMNCFGLFAFGRMPEEGESNTPGNIRGIAHHGNASWGVVAASARCKTLI